MKIIGLPLILFVIFLSALAFLLSGNQQAEAAKPAKMTCKSCHADLAAVIPKGHPPVKGNDLASCLPCHKPDMSGTGKKNVFSMKMHMAHVPPKGKVDCLTCHRWMPGKSFTLIGKKRILGGADERGYGVDEGNICIMGGFELYGQPPCESQHRLHELPWQRHTQAGLDGGE